MSVKPKGYPREVYRSLMDLALLLSEVGAMGTLMLFLDSIDPDNPALSKLHGEILTFTARIQGLVDVAKKL